MVDSTQRTNRGMNGGKGSSTGCSHSAICLMTLTVAERKPPSRKYLTFVRSWAKPCVSAVSHRQVLAPTWKEAPSSAGGGREVTWTQRSASLAKVNAC